MPAAAASAVLRVIRTYRIELHVSYSETHVQSIRIVAGGNVYVRCQ